MDDFQLGILILAGLSALGAIGLGVLWILKSTPAPTAVQNEGSWEWTDWMGHPRTLTGHRKVEQKETVVKL